MKKYLPLFLLILALTDCSACNRTVEAPDAPQTDPIITLTPTTITNQEISNPADIIFHNGTIVTVDANFTVVEAIAIQENKILAVGSDQEILELVGQDTVVIDLNGRTILPGFIDGHTHVLHGPYGGRGVSYDEAMEAALSYGLTTVNEMYGEAGFIEELQHLEQEDKLRLRVNVFTISNLSILEDKRTVLVESPWYENNEPILDHDRMVRVTGVKIFADGAGGDSRGCPALTIPFEEVFQENQPEVCGTLGNLYLAQDELNKLLFEVQEAGFSVSMHAMGDLGIDTALNAIEYALNGESNHLYRHAIQHNSWLRPDQIDRYQEVGALASVRGYFNSCEQGFYEEYYGPSRQGWWANRFALANLGIHAYGEGDFGWTSGHEDRTFPRPLDPLLTLYGLVTHKQLQSDGSACDPGEELSQHQIPIETALRMLTIEPAYAVFQEDFIGSLEPGKFADLIILSENPLTVDPAKLADLKVWMTMVGGKVEYCTSGHDELCSLLQSGRIEYADPEEPLVDPVTVKISLQEEQVSAGTPVMLTYGWACDSEAQMVDFIAATLLEVTLDGQLLADTQDFWGEIGEAGDIDGDGDVDYLSTWSYPLGVLDPGTYLVESQVSLTNMVTDGFDFDGDSLLDEYSGIINDFSLQLTVED